MKIVASAFLVTQAELHSPSHFKSKIKLINLKRLPNQHYTYLNCVTLSRNNPLFFKNYIEPALFHIKLNKIRSSGITMPFGLTMNIRF